MNGSAKMVEIACETLKFAARQDFLGKTTGIGTATAVIVWHSPKIARTSHSRWGTAPRMVMQNYNDPKSDADVADYATGRLRVAAGGPLLPSVKIGKLRRDVVGDVLRSIEEFKIAA